MTIQQIQAAINSKANDPRQLINMIADYLQANPGGSPSPGSSYLVKSEVTLTDAQIKALPTTQIEVVAAPGVGKYLLPMGGFIQSNFISAYTNITGASLNLRGFSGLMSGIVFTQVFLANTGNIVMTIPPNDLTLGSGLFANKYYNAARLGGIEDYPILITDEWSGSGSDYTGGNAANTLKVTVYYVVVDL